MAGLVKRENTLFFNKRKQTTFDWKFLDRLIKENFYIGGTDIVVFNLAGVHDQCINLFTSSNPEITITAGTQFAQHRGPEKSSLGHFNLRGNGAGCAGYDGRCIRASRSPL